MSRKLSVHLLPTLAEPSDLVGGLAVVIDVLRASTTIVHALAAGARAVIPCSEVGDARQAAARLPQTEVLLGGERAGQRIEGFDLDNSPQQYTEASVGGKSVVFTTTNGTRALNRAADAGRILFGAFVNINAVIDTLADDGRPIHLVCAGTDGRVSCEDVLCAGALAAGVQTAVGPIDSENDQAKIALAAYRSLGRNRQTFDDALDTSLGGTNLRKLGFAADIRRSATWDLFDIVPEYSRESARIERSAEPPANRKHWLSAPGK